MQKKTTPKSKPKSVAKSDGPKTLKTDLKNVHSRAYHKHRKLAENNGMTPLRAKKHAQMMAKQAVDAAVANSGA